MEGGPPPQAQQSASTTLSDSPTQEHMSRQVPTPSPSPGTSRPSPTTQVSTPRWTRPSETTAYIPPSLPAIRRCDPQRPPHRWRWRPDTRSLPPHNRVSRNEPPSRRLHAPPPPPLGAHPHPQHPKSPPSPPGLDLPPIAQRPQAHATQATNPPEMHLRPQRTAACHRYGHPRGCPGAPGPRRRRAGGTPQPGPPASGAAWAARVRARGALGMTGVRGGTRGRRGEDCGAGPRTPPPGSARYRPGSEAAASPRALATAPAEPPARAPPAPPPRRAPAQCWRPSTRWRRCRAPCKAICRRAGCHLPPGSFMLVPTGFSPLAAWLGRPQGLCTTDVLHPEVSSPAR